MATSSGLSSRSCELQKGKEVVVKSKGDTSDSLRSSTFPLHVTYNMYNHPGKNVKEEAVFCLLSTSMSEDNRNRVRAAGMWSRIVYFCIVGLVLASPCNTDIVIQKIALICVLYVLIACQVMNGCLYFLSCCRSHRKMRQ